MKTDRPAPVVMELTVIIKVDTIEVNVLRKFQTKTKVKETKNTYSQENVQKKKKREKKKKRQNSYFLPLQLFDHYQSLYLVNMLHVLSPIYISSNHTFHNQIIVFSDTKVLNYHTTSQIYFHGLDDAENKQLRRRKRAAT